MEKNNKELEEKEVAGASGGVIVPTTVIAKQGNFLPAFDGDVDQKGEISVEQLRGASGGRVWVPKILEAAVDDDSSDKKIVDNDI